MKHVFFSLAVQLRLVTEFVFHAVYISVFSRPVSMWPENSPSVNDVVLISGGRLFHANGPATEKLRGQKPVVLVRGTTRSPRPAERKWRHVETAETGLIIDTRYGVASW